MPLTLITGWYGMNFTGMPELGWPHGYIYVIVLSVVVCALSFLILKRKSGLSPQKAYPAGLPSCIPSVGYPDRMPSP